ncbi:MAG: diacylglycerol/lipid kinase family protein [Microthrixaceae bacterium]
MDIHNNSFTAYARRHPRRMAWIALGSGVATAAVLALMLVTNLPQAVLGLLGLASAGAGGWFFATSPGAKRMIALLPVLGGVAVVLFALVEAVDPDIAAIRIGLVAIGAAVATVCARSAVATGTHTVFVRSQPPQRPVLICNPRSGGGKVGKFDLVPRAEAMGVRTVVLEPGDDLLVLAREAVADGCDCVGMAGGDGSQALVASVAVEAGLPYVCISAGTRNHFALDLGLDRDDPAATLQAFSTGLTRRIDYATVEAGGVERLFVNNVSLGVYATIVQEDSYRDAKASTAFEMLPDMLGNNVEPFDLGFRVPDGAAVDGAFLVMVSNNPYVFRANSDLGRRYSLESGELGVFALDSTTAAEAAGLMALSALGAQRSSPNWHEFTATSFEIDSHSGTAFAGVDGEALELATPMTFRIHPGGLTVMVPHDNPHAVRKIHARGVGLDDLIATARGSGRLASQ